MQQFSTRFYDKVPESEPLKYQHRPVLAERHTCTDPICGLIFFACLSFGGYIMSYAIQNGDPRKVYHGMDYEGNICGVDLPWKPYVYWCSNSQSQASPVPNGAPQAFGSLAAVTTGAQSFFTAPSSLDFSHPICVADCPQSAVTQSMCFNAQTGGQTLKADYATHPVAKRYCFPQAQAMMDKVMQKNNDHPFQKYLPLVISTAREGWPVLLGAFFVGFILSSIYLLLIECLAGLVIWATLISLIIIPGASGAYLITASQHGGVDGIPSSGDAQTDLSIGIGCCVASAFFLFVTCCMRNAIAKAVDVVESAAQCLFECKSLLLEPIINLVTRITVWTGMLYGLAYLLSTGEIQKNKVYRSFTYTEEQYIYIGFYVFLMLWINDFMTAMSQYVIANASARWYFTEHIGGMKLAPSCLLCKGYCTGWLYHFGSLAFGSLLISIFRPIRICVLAVVMAEELVDNAACGCIARCCFCCVECFNSFLVHLSKNAYIDIAITSKNFCAAGQNAADLLLRQSKTMIASAGATWIFTLAGLMSVTTAGALITSVVVQNAEQFNRPTSRFYIQDPMVCAAMAGVICFIVALGFMIVFDSVSDTMIICLAYDRDEMKSNPVPVFKQGAPRELGGTCGGWFGGSSMVGVQRQGEEIRRPQFCPAKMATWQ